MTLTNGIIIVVAIFFYAFTTIYSYKFDSSKFRKGDAKCGPYGFKCVSQKKLKLCDEYESTYGPTFLCPDYSFCSEETAKVCEPNYSYIDPSLEDADTRNCRKNDRVPDPTVPRCKGYILCIENKNKRQRVKFQCSGNAIFNPFRKSCSTPKSFKCKESINRTNSHVNRDNNEQQLYSEKSINGKSFKPINCKNYRLTLNDETIGDKVSYFCPKKPAPGDSLIYCTIFSSNFCVALPKDEPQLYGESRSNRKPRIDGIDLNL